ncbi:MAG TPA: serine/threonine-protein kinase [Gemmatimonadales bacterium]|nr:serine/threonine-protein kinase [Gemmatimonadales bacterium]
MPDTNWTRVDALLAEALEWPVAERAARLAERTEGEPELLRQVTELLESADQAERLIGDSALELIPAEESLPAETGLEPGERVGPYRIIRELGRGGMATVYLGARDDQAFDREVALKVVRGAQAADVLSRRFVAERRILARLEHRNIARLYDSVVTSAGQPCLVMEYVAGSRIDRHADDRRLGIPERLRLFLSVCDGVSYAHQQLVVHRDLKPANIQVNEAGEVKLLDFGIARLLVPDDAETPITRPGFRPITPEYAPPEQVRGDPPTARADVYSLGVILHELLTGERPGWQRQILEQAGPELPEVTLVAPSRSARARLATDPDTSRDRAAARGLTAAGLPEMLRGDLDAIVLTALAPDPNHRYPSVEALREDVSRHLAGQPIVARPPSRTYRAGKFLSRNRGVVAAGVILVILTVGYFATILVQSARIQSERDRAEQERDRADQVVQVLTNLLAASDPFAAARPDTLRVTDFLASSAERVQAELAEQPLVLARVLGVLGMMQGQLGKFNEAAPQLERSVSLLRTTRGAAPADLAEGLGDLAIIRRRTSRLPEADSLLREAMAIATASSGESSALFAKLEGRLGSVLVERGQFDSAAVVLESAIHRTRSLEPVDTSALAELLNNRGVAAQRLGDRAGAVPWMREAHELRSAELGADHPLALQVLSNLAFLIDRMGSPAEAIPMFEEAIDGLTQRLGPGHSATLAVRRNLGSALSRSDRLPEAIAMLEAVEAVERRRVGGNRFELGITLDYLGGMYDQAGRYAESERAFRENYEIFRDAVGPDHFNTALALGRHAWARCRPGVEITPSTAAAAIRDLERALVVIDGVMPPANNQRITRHVMYGTCLSRAGRHADAEAELVRQADLARGGFPTGDPTLRFSLGELAGHFARTGQGDREAGVRALADTLAVAQPRP